MAEVIVTVKPNGDMVIEGEGTATKALRRNLRSLGNVTEEHVGAEHQRIAAPTQQQKVDGS